MLGEQEICGLYRLGRLSCRNIARMDGRSVTTIYFILKKNNILFRDKSEANKIVSDNVLIFLYNLGLSFQQIDRLIGIDPSTISKRFALIKYPLRSRRTSINIRYSSEEFDEYFCNSEFLESCGVLINGDS